MLSWAARRQLTVIFSILGFLIVLGLIAFLIYRPRASCFDKNLNQGELGVDCGGLCAAVCPNEAVPPQVIWSRLLPRGDGRFEAAALVENPNAGFGVSRLGYNFKILDQNGVLIATKRGVTFLNPQEKFLIFEPMLDLGARAPARAIVELAPATWRRLPTSVKPNLLISESRFVSLTPPRLSAQLTNQTLEDLTIVTVGVVLSDSQQNVIAASLTQLDQLKRNDTRQLIFTWPAAFSATPVLIDYYPRINSVGEAE